MISIRWAWKFTCHNQILMTNWLNVCFESRLQGGWNNYYMFENKCNQIDTRGQEVIDAIQCYGDQVLLYKVEVWCDTISLSTCNEIDKI